ncbi:MAG: hypothetical protein EZS28_049558 [Streblomastix strix]|uniref:Uncharacterized protein n=1 Tax=Streblomastix strix TaxID=222440 RepID=A0A5J4TBT1_9EUKA|nr:MAG: hypothetical protein EZS28_049558 [Streblomastix strix]
MRIQTEAIGVGGGSEEQNFEVIEAGFVFIYSIFNINREKDDEKYHGQPQLLKTIYEQLEDEGGLEEIEANLFHKKQQDQDDVQQEANETKKKINNIRKDKSNR